MMCARCLLVDVRNSVHYETRGGDGVCSVHYENFANLDHHQGALKTNFEINCMHMTSQLMCQ